LEYQFDRLLHPKLPQAYEVLVPDKLGAYVLAGVVAQILALSILPLGLGWRP
jgi:hypothetical protein